MAPGAAAQPSPGSRSLPADLLGLAKGGSAHPAGAAPAARPPRQASRAAIAVVVGFLLVALLLAWKGLSGLADPFTGTAASTERSTPTPSPRPSGSGPSGTASPTSSGAPTPVTVQQVAGFDPQGDGGENDGDADLATDGDPETFWSSETYRTATFGGLKRGVGLRLDLDGRQDVHRVEVEVGGSGATVQLRRANGDRLSSRVLAEQQDAAGTVTLEPGTAVAADELVVWFTRAGRGEGGYRVEVAEVKVS